MRAVTPQFAVKTHDSRQRPFPASPASTVNPAQAVDKSASN